MPVAKGGGVLGDNHRRITVRRLFSLLVAAIFTWGLVGCGEDRIEISQAPSTEEAFPTPRTEQLSEVAPPPVIQQLNQSLDAYQPQVAIVSPTADEVLQDNTVKVEFQVQDLPIFQDPELGLGLHLHVILDNQIHREVYELDQPLVFEDLSPGTHTLRVFASRPWYESFKNEGAYAQTTFHLFTKTTDNNPDPALPILTYNHPQGSYGAEPIMLDFYLTNAPLHLVAAENSEDEIVDWRIRVTVNGQSFILDNWQPFYLQGFKPGKNWVHLEFLDEQGNPVKNVFNDTVRLISYEPEGQDTLSQLVRGELELEVARSIIEPNYQTIPQPAATELPEELEEVEEPSPAPAVVSEEEASTVSEPLEEASIVQEEEEEVSVAPESLEEISTVSEEEEASIAPEPLEEASIVSEEEKEASVAPESLEEASIVSEEEEDTSLVPESPEETSELGQSVIPDESPAPVEESEPVLEAKKNIFGGFFERVLKLVKREDQQPAPVVPEELEEIPVPEDTVIPSEAPTSVEEITPIDPAATSEEEDPLPEAVVIPEELEADAPISEDAVIPTEEGASVEEITTPETTATSEEEVPLSEAVVIPEELEADAPISEDALIPNESPASIEEITPPEIETTSEEETLLPEADSEEPQDLSVLEDDVVTPSESPVSVEEITPLETATTSEE